MNRLISSLFLSFSVFVLSTRAQDLSVGNLQISTVGGITYFRCTVHVPPCHNLLPAQLSGSGTNLNLAFRSQGVLGCITFPENTGYDTNYTAVLGALSETNTYRLVILVYDNEFPLPSMTYADYSPTNQTPSSTLSINSAVAATNFAFQVSGVAGARYIIETSTNFVDWQDVSTNSGPFTFSTVRNPFETNRVYRTRILSSQ